MSFFGELATPMRTAGACYRYQDGGLQFCTKGVVTDWPNEFGNVNNSLRYTYGENILVLPNHSHDNLEQRGREDDDTIKRMWFFEIN